MTGTYISASLRRRVAERARYRCGYCQTRQDIVGMPMEIDHIVPQALGGPTIEDSLWLACSLCNAHKGDRLVAFDPVSGQAVRLFDPARQRWSEHFTWTDDGGTRTIGLTPIGRATAAVTNPNRLSIVRARRRWVSVGWHPPADE